MQAWSSWRGSEATEAISAGSNRKGLLRQPFPSLLSSRYFRLFHYLVCSRSHPACPDSSPTGRGAAVIESARIAHIGIAVESIEGALPFYRDVLGLTPTEAEEKDGARIVSLVFGPSDVELLEPRSPDSPIAKFLARRGPGIHHVCYRVPDLDAALAAAAAAGYQLVDEVPRIGAHGHRIAFLHPRTTAGILIELTE
jgi:methylmalonyl-CoA/ethylmalonyl-CoA epimerase